MQRNAEVLAFQDKMVEVKTVINFAFVRNQ